MKNFTETCITWRELCIFDIVIELTSRWETNILIYYLEIFLTCVSSGWMSDFELSMLHELIKEENKVVQRWQWREKRHLQQVNASLCSTQLESLNIVWLWLGSWKQRIIGRVCSGTFLYMSMTWYQCWRGKSFPAIWRCHTIPGCIPPKSGLHQWKMV